MAEVTRYREEPMITVTEARRLIEQERGRAYPAAVPTPRSNVPWIVTGCLIGLVLLLSFAWGLFTRMMEMNHELAMAAAQRPEVTGGGDMTIVYVLCAVAGLCIVLGLRR